ncbi:hypothetical protein KEM48_013949 [Puccinia striiformis f. sp. tritici PST-130]|nr:hypothetical protein KEM48_013949 [Puccinia striiformis f. sp. tritici PST-130]
MDLLPEIKTKTRRLCFAFFAVTLACDALMKGSWHDPIDLVSDHGSIQPQSTNARPPMTPLPSIPNSERPLTNEVSRNNLNTAPRHVDHGTANSFAEVLPIEQDAVDRLETVRSPRRGQQGPGDTARKSASFFGNRSGEERCEENDSGIILDNQPADSHAPEWRSSRPWTRQSERQIPHGTRNFLSRLGKRPLTPILTSPEETWTNVALSKESVPNRINGGNQYIKTFENQSQRDHATKNMKVDDSNPPLNYEHDTRDFLSEVGQGSGSRVQVFDELQANETIDLLYTLGKNSRTGNLATNRNLGPLIRSDLPIQT